MRNTVRDQRRLSAHLGGVSLNDGERWRSYLAVLQACCAGIDGALPDHLQQLRTHFVKGSKRSDRVVIDGAPPAVDVADPAAANAERGSNIGLGEPRLKAQIAQA